MQPPNSITTERQDIYGALLQVERRLRLNRIARAAALCGGLVLLALITWRVLVWLDGMAPAASALIVLLAIIAGLGLFLLIGQHLLGGALDRARAASEADRRGGLHDELLSALWFMRDDGERRPASRAWIDVQLQRAARTAAKLQTTQLIPVRLPRNLLAGLLVGVILLALTWRPAPLSAVQEMLTPKAQDSVKADAQVLAMRKLIETMPPTDARRQLEAALRTLESGSSSAGERRQAIAQAQQAVDRIKLDAAASREELQKLSKLLAGQPGLEEAAQALAGGDAQRAAELIAKAQAEGANKDSGNAPVPPDTKDEKPQDQATQQLTNTMAEAQGARAGGETPQVLADRLKQIARELKAANFVSEAWKEVKGPQMEGGRSNLMAAGRYDEQQRRVDGDPSPGSSTTPMSGGTQLRAPVVSQGQGTEEQDGGTRMGSAIGDGKVDPLLGEGGQRLDMQLKQHALQGQEGTQQRPDQEWFYAESQKRGAQTAWRTVNARTRYADAQIATAGGISVKHRKVTKDFFVKRPEPAK